MTAEEPDENTMATELEQRAEALKQSLSFLWGDKEPAVKWGTPEPRHPKEHP